MEQQVKDILNLLIERYPALEGQKNSISEAYLIMKACYDGGGKLLIGGNGGSASDSSHIVGELMKSFVKERPASPEFKEKLAALGGTLGGLLADTLQCALPAIDITQHTSLNTAYGNDISSDCAFAQQVFGYGKAGDVFLGISTSGNSKNVIMAAMVAKALDMKVVALTGRDGGELAGLCDCAIIVPEQETYKIQELHLPVYHALCLMLEETYF